MNDGVCESMTSLQLCKLSVPPRHILGTQARTILRTPHSQWTCGPAKASCLQTTAASSIPAQEAPLHRWAGDNLVYARPGEPHVMAHGARENAPAARPQGAGGRVPVHPPSPGTAARAVCRTLRVPHACVPVPPGERHFPQAPAA